MSTPRYEIHVRGRLSDALLPAFPELTSRVLPVETVLTGPVEDQSALLGLLERVESLGLELLEIRQLPDEN
jgi:hypothetical protein